MCGRYSLRKDKTAYSDYLLELGFEAFHEVPRYNIAPTQSTPVVRLTPEGGAELARLRWGLIPSWARDPSIGSRMINARAETVATKPSFRSAFKRRRALIPADGYYEWRREGSRKRPFRFQRRGNPVFTFAGLWEEALFPDGTTWQTFTILTCPPNPIAAAIHDRMPVIIEPKDYDEWLHTGASRVARLQALLRPYAADDLEYYEVSTAVNSPRNDSPECATPLPEANAPDLWR